MAELFTDCRLESIGPEGKPLRYMDAEAEINAWCPHIGAIMVLITQLHAKTGFGLAVFSLLAYLVLKYVLRSILHRRELAALSVMKVQEFECRLSSSKVVSRIVVRAGAATLQAIRDMPPELGDPQHFTGRRYESGFLAIWALLSPWFVHERFFNDCGLGSASRAVAWCLATTLVGISLLHLVCPMGADRLRYRISPGRLEILSIRALRTDTRLLRNVGLRDARIRISGDHSEIGAGTQDPTIHQEIDLKQIRNSQEFVMALIAAALTSRAPIALPANQLVG